MQQDCPSRTALHVARLRAAHQLLDDPKIFADPLALGILGLDEGLAQDPKPDWLEDTPLSRGLRASVAARSRYAEDELELGIKRGVSQYVVLGAGLDTFACRNPHPQDVLRVFEVDHPATQAWKRMRLEQAGITLPQALTFVPMDLESETLSEGLRRAGFDFSQPTFFSWLGVTMYLTRSAVDATLELVAAMPVGSGIVFDYMKLPSLMSAAERSVFDHLAQRVALASEPFATFFDPSSLSANLRAMGFGHIEDLEPKAMDTRYFQGRTDNLRMGRLAHVMNARV